MKNNKGKNKDNKNKSSKTTRVNYHDITYKRLFYNKFIVESLLTDIVRYPYRFDIDQSITPFSLFLNQNQQEVRDDIIWRIKLIDDPVDYVDFMLEHQSTNDYFMPFRVGGYKYSYIDAVIDRTLYDDDKLFYPIILIVIYNGKKEWTAKLDAHELMRVNHKDDFNSYYQNELKYILVDLSHIDVNELSKNSLMRPIIMIEQANTPESLNAGVQEAIHIYKEDKFVSVRKAIIQWVINIPYIHRHIDNEVIYSMNTLEDLNNMIAENLDLWENNIRQEVSKEVSKKFTDKLDAMAAENNAIAAEKNAIAAEKNVIAAENNAMTSKIDKMSATMDKMSATMDKMSSTMAELSATWINAAKKLGQSFDEISNKFAQMFGIPLNDAEKEVKKYWD